MDDWNGLFVPADTPVPVMAKLQSAVAQACRDPGVQERMAPLGTVLGGQSTAEFTAWLANLRQVVERVIREARITLG